MADLSFVINTAMNRILIVSQLADLLWDAGILTEGFPEYDSIEGVTSKIVLRRPTTPRLTDGVLTGEKLATIWNFHYPFSEVTLHNTENAPGAYSEISVELRRRTMPEFAEYLRQREQRLSS